MSRDILIAASVLSANFSHLGEEIQKITQAGADWIHIDVMDGHFVPNLTFGAKVVKDIRSQTTLPVDVHLMISPVDPFIEDFVTAGADNITVHPEAGPHIYRTLQRIKSFNKKAGIAINPGTPVEVLPPLLDLVDLVLVMTVNPGFGGQTFIASQLDKIKTVRSLIDVSKRKILLEVDGGITPESASLVLNAGADVLVAGTSIFKTSHYAQNIQELRVY